MSSRIKDIADYLGLSPATVSMVLNNRPGFSEETRRRVADAARQLNYQPAPLKRPAAEINENLPFIICKRHGQVISETPFFAALIEAIENEAKNKGYNLSIHYLNMEQPLSPENIRGAVSRSKKGFLVLATEMESADCAAFESLDIPFVFIDNTMLGVKADKVLIGNYQGAYAAVEELYLRGHRRIGYLHSSVWISNFEEREIGFRLAVKELSLDYRGEWTARIGCTYETAYREMLEYCEQVRDMPTAFFADNDIIAMGAMKALTEKGYKLPDDISIIGFDDMPYCTMVSPNLSTMRVDTRNIGAAAVRLLLENNGFRQTIQIETELIRRESIRAI